MDGIVMRLWKKHLIPSMTLGVSSLPVVTRKLYTAFQRNCPSWKRLRVSRDVSGDTLGTMCQWFDQIVVVQVGMTDVVVEVDIRTDDVTMAARMEVPVAVVVTVIVTGTTVAAADVWVTGFLKFEISTWMNIEHGNNLLLTWSFMTSLFCPGAGCKQLFNSFSKQKWYK